MQPNTAPPGENNAGEQQPIHRKDRTTWPIGRSAFELVDVFRGHVKLSAIRAEAVIPRVP